MPKPDSDLSRHEGDPRPPGVIQWESCPLGNYCVACRQVFEVGDKLAYMVVQTHIAQYIALCHVACPATPEQEANAANPFQMTATTKEE